MKSFSPIVVSACLVLFLNAPSPGLVAQTNELSTALDRAAEYVARYEDKELGNLLVAETYLQTAMTYNFMGRGVTHTDRRHMQSDFLILAIGPDRVGLRLVNSVDGNPVQKKQTSFEAALGNSSNVKDQLAAINQESSRYNIGDVQREINVPTFALRVVRKTEAIRFSFARREEKKLSGVDTWEIKFQEQRSPTLTHGIHGESLLSSGSLWIEPKSGRILKTEFRVENPYSDPKVKATITVTYKDNKPLGILVPAQMDEQYTSEFTTINAVANYSNYRQFRVDVKSSIGSNPPRLEVR